MLQQRIEARWIDAFVRVYRLCGVQVGESAAILSETQSRAVNVQLAELALAQLGARAFHVVVPTPALTAPVPVRSTGASDAIGGLAPVVQALATSTDRTVEGLLHAPELPGILASGAHVA
ncbi:MAG: peptidase M29, partial [Burkholderiaceae bacterium]